MKENISLESKQRREDFGEEDRMCVRYLEYRKTCQRTDGRYKPGYDEWTLRLKKEFDVQRSSKVFRGFEDVSRASEEFRESFEES
jgi:hypothetical protein